MFDIPLISSILDASHHTAAGTATQHPVHAHENNMLYEWKGEKAGVYDNAWDDLDTTPHVWGATTNVDPSEIDCWIPYGPVHPCASPGVEAASFPTHHVAVAANLKAAYDGTCNPMPGWGVSWNPQTGGGCTLNPDYGQPGLGDGASYGSGAPARAAIAAPALCALPEGEEARTIRPTCGHYLLATEACVFGALSATSDMLGKIASGRAAEGVEGWRAAFESESLSAAGSCTAMGAFVLDRHVFKKQQLAA